MSQPIRSVAVLEPLEGKHDELLAWLREFYAMMQRKNYSRDTLYCDVKHEGRYIHLRVWNSEDARSQAQQDPDVHKFWMKLPELCTITRIYEHLEPVFSNFAGEEV